MHRTPEKATPADVKLTDHDVCCLVAPNLERKLTKRNPMVRNVAPVMNVVAMHAAPMTQLSRLPFLFAAAVLLQTVLA